MKILQRIRSFLRARKELKQFQSLPQSDRRIVFYSEDVHSMIHFEKVIDRLNSKFQLKVCYLTSDSNDPVFNLGESNILPFYIGDGIVRTSAFYKMNASICIMTMPDIETFHLKRSKVYPVHYLYLFHAMVSTHYNYRKSAFDHYDTIFCTGSHHIDEIRETERVYGLKPKHLFPDGYRRIEELIENVGAIRSENPNFNQERKTVILAPSWGADATLETCGEEIVGLLLSAGYRTIVRPHPMTTKHNEPLIKGLFEKFNKNNLFQLQTDIRDEKTLYESHVMISDWSGVALEYAFACERPVIFIDVPRKCNNLEADKISLEPFESSVRNKIGRIVSPDHLQSLVGSIEELYKDSTTFIEQIRKVRNESIFNLGNSLEKATDEIGRLLDLSQMRR